MNANDEFEIMNIHQYQNKLTKCSNRGFLFFLFNKKEH